MPIATLPPTSLHSHSRTGRSRHRRSAPLPTKFPNLAPRSTLISPIISDLNPTKRIDILHPPSVPRRTVALETAESQFHMHRRCIVMQHQQWIRQHGEWQKAMYGAPAVKEDYRSNIRSMLKSQMADRVKTRHGVWLDGVRESILVSERDYNDNMNDAMKRRARYNFLHTFTKANKEMMESQWKKRKEQKLLENRRDAEQLTLNPINWSHTLK